MSKSSSQNNSSKNKAVYRLPKLKEYQAHITIIIAFFFIYLVVHPWVSSFYINLLTPEIQKEVEIVYTIQEVDEDGNETPLDIPINGPEAYIHPMGKALAAFTLTLVCYALAELIYSKTEIDKAHSHAKVISTILKVLFGSLVVFVFVYNTSAAEYTSNINHYFLESSSNVFLQVMTHFLISAPNRIPILEYLTIVSGTLLLPLEHLQERVN